MKGYIMANYVSTTSDKSKKTAKRLLLCGGVGLHYFYVGRIKAGLIRSMIGVLLWFLFIEGIIEHKTAMVASGIGFLLALNLFELLKLSLGKFRDNIGNYLRQ